MPSFRLIKTGHKDAATNMAIDEAMFICRSRKTNTPVFRIYGWKSPSISVGRSQKPQDILNLERCRQKNISVVRRPTGGGMLLHDKEVTYSVALNQDDLSLPKGVKKSFEEMTSFLIDAYKLLGVTSDFSKKTVKDPHGISQLCLLRTEEYDITIKNKKIGGNAQARKKETILQHGSVPFSLDNRIISEVLKDPLLFDKNTAVSLEQVCQDYIKPEKITDALIKAFSARFGIELKESALTQEEEKLANDLKKNKYSSPDWNIYGKYEDREKT